MQAEFLHDEHIFIDLNIEHRDEMFKHVSRILLKNGYIKDNYLVNVIDREEKYPTGFKLKNLNVAMPHVAPEHVMQNGLFVVTNKHGIVFKNAETDQDLKVHIVFGLLLKDSTTHLNFLMKLATSFKDDQQLHQILNSTTKAEVKEWLNSILSH